jgi:prepilin-type processing-associated H-X9-DG protein
MLSYLGEQPTADALAAANTNPPNSGPAQAAIGIRIEILRCTSESHEEEGPPVLDYAINAGRVNVSANGWTNHDWKANGGSYDALRPQSDYMDYRNNRMTDSDLVDGTTNTIAFAENNNLQTWCIFPQTGVNAIPELYSGVVWDPAIGSLSPYPQGHPASPHPGGFNLSMWDGSAKFVSNTMDYTVYARLMSSDGRRTTDPSAASYSGATPVWQQMPISNSDY